MSRESQIIDVLAAGALVADIYANTGTTVRGGAEANFAAACAQQGVATAFTGCVGDDGVGPFLKQSLKHQGVNVEFVGVRPDLNTRRVYIENKPSGDRQFSNISTENCADLDLRVDQEVVDMKTAGLFGLHGRQYGITFLHFGSLSQLQDPSRTAITRMIELAVENQILVSYDPNIRAMLWPSKDMCLRVVRETARSAHILKLSEDELYYLTGSHEMSAAHALHDFLENEILIITRGAQGADIMTSRLSLHVDAPCVNAVDSTGAGDAFGATFIAGLLPYVKLAPSRVGVLDTIAKDQVERIAARACAAGAWVCQRIGATLMPTAAQIDSLLAEIKV